MNVHEKKLELQREAQELRRRLSQIEEIMQAYSVLERNDCLPENSGSIPENPIRREVQDALPSFQGREYFTLPEVRQKISTPVSPMTIRKALDGFVANGSVRVVAKGSKGRATRYQIPLDANPNREMDDNDVVVINSEPDT